MKRIKVAIIGSGNIGIDLAERLLDDSRFELYCLIGRRRNSEGLLRFKDRIPFLLDSAAYSLKQVIHDVDGVFDATSAFDHEEHWKIVQNASRWIVDLTPSRIGSPISPVLTTYLKEMKIQDNFVANYSMITCGGQSAAPMLFAIREGVEDIFDVEISSSIAALSAGPATRKNIDNYIETTQALGSLITNCESTKAVLVLNPAEPPVMMRTTVQVLGSGVDLTKIHFTLNEVTKQLVKYVPGYKVSVMPTIENHSLVSATALVEGSGYYLPKYAGNLDIINAAAVETAYRHSLRHSGETIETV